MDKFICFIFLFVLREVVSFDPEVNFLRPELKWAHVYLHSCLGLIEYAVYIMMGCVWIIIINILELTFQGARSGGGCLNMTYLDLIPSTMYGPQAPPRMICEHRIHPII